MQVNDNEATMRRFQAALFLGLVCLGLTGCIFERDHGRGGDGRAYYEHDHYRR